MSKLLSPHLMSIWRGIKKIGGGIWESPIAISSEFVIIIHEGYNRPMMNTFKSRSSSMPPGTFRTDAVYMGGHLPFPGSKRPEQQRSESGYLNLAGG